MNDFFPPSNHRATGSGKIVVAVAVAVAFALVSGSGLAAPAGTTSPAIAHGTRLGPGDTVQGALPLGEPVHIEIALKLRDREGLDAFIANAARHPFDGASHVMNSAQVMERHAPTAAQAQAVANYLASMGYTHIRIAPNRLLVSADGTALAASKAFGVSLARVKTHAGRLAYANTNDVHVPSVLADKVLAVVGLQNVHRPDATAPRADAAHPMTGHPRTPHNPLDYPLIYGGSGAVTGAGVTIGVLTQGDLTQVIADLNTYTANNSLATVSTQVVNTGGTSSDTSKTSVWDVESQSIVGMAGGQLGGLIYYNVPTMDSAGLTANLNAAVAANATRIISVAFAQCETDAQADGSAAADDAILATAVAQGQTFAVSTGDNVAGDPCNTPVHHSTTWPASSQYVLAVGGSSVLAALTTWQNESPWVIGDGSVFEPVPGWQAAMRSPATTRGTPDVVFNGDPAAGAMITVNGAPATVGGTALSAALFAGQWARVLRAAGTSLGFAGPAIYYLNIADFHDMSPASYDLWSGRGSILLNKEIAELKNGYNHPPSPGFSWVVNGSSVAFTDHASDSDGTIVSYMWGFSGGSVSTQQNPTHVYPVDGGTYSASESVTDNGGASSFVQRLITIPAPAQRLLNNGFEAGNDGSWKGSTPVIRHSNAEPAATGTWDAWLLGRGVLHSDTLWQQVAIPAGKSCAELRFKLHVDSAETTPVAVHDWMKVNVTDASGHVLATLHQFSNLGQWGGYQQQAYDLSPWIGQTIRIQFSAHENATLQTSFVIDDVQVLDN